LDLEYRSEARRLLLSAFEASAIFQSSWGISKNTINFFTMLSLPKSMKHTAGSFPGFPCPLPTLVFTI
jgi:hypothetical protein